MRQVIVEVDCGEKECGDCDLLRDTWMRKATCAKFGKIYLDDKHPNYSYVRLPACLEAEAKLKRLVEAGREAEQCLSKGRVRKSLRSALKVIDHE